MIGEVLGRRFSSVTGSAVLNYEASLKKAMATRIALHGSDVVGGIFFRHASGFHLAAMHDQEHQHIHGAMTDIFKFLPFDQTGDGPSDRLPLQNLEVGDFVHTDHPKPALGQIPAISVAPQHLFGPLLELGVQPRRLPVAGAVWLQVDVVQDLPHRARADGFDDAIHRRLAGQVQTGPVGDVQSFGDRLQTGQLDDLSALEGGKAAVGDRAEWLPTTRYRVHVPRNRGKPAKRCQRGIASERRYSGRASRLRHPEGFGHAGLGTTGASGFALSFPGLKHHEDPTSTIAVFGHAWATSSNKGATPTSVAAAREFLAQFHARTTSNTLCSVFQLWRTTNVHSKSVEL